MLLLIVTAPMTFAETQILSETVSFNSKKDEMKIMVEELLQDSGLAAEFSSSPEDYNMIKNGLVNAAMSSVENHQLLLLLKETLPEILALSDEEEKRERLGGMYMALIIMAAKYAEA